jgi:hypothetical protein
MLYTVAGVVYEKRLVELTKFNPSLLYETPTSPAEESGVSHWTMVRDIHFAGTIFSPNLQQLVSSG